MLDKALVEIKEVHQELKLKLGEDSKMRTRGKRLGIAGIALSALGLVGCGAEAIVAGIGAAGAARANGNKPAEPVKTTAELIKDYNAAIEKLKTDSETRLKGYDEKFSGAVDKYKAQTVRSGYEFMKEEAKREALMQDYQKQRQEVLKAIAEEIKGMGEE
jgi:hypothetical protein